LGGSSSINGAHYTRGLKAQYDAWSTLLEPSEAKVGWNWNGIFGYMKKASCFYAEVPVQLDVPSLVQSEGFSPPNAQQAAKGAQYIPSYHGMSGPVQVTYPDAMYGGPQQPDFVNTIVGLTGIPHSEDLNGGSPNCVSITPLARNFYTALPAFPECALDVELARLRPSLVLCSGVLDPC
jgi:choline dehydrogenase